MYGIIKKSPSEIQGKTCSLNGMFAWWEMQTQMFKKFLVNHPAGNSWTTPFLHK